MSNNAKTSKTVIITLVGKMPSEDGTLYDYLVNEMNNHGIQAYITEIDAPHSVAEAAPDLLSELQFLADQWAQEFDNDSPINGGDFVAWFAECLPRIRRTIAKATEGA